MPPTANHLQPRFGARIRVRRESLKLTQGEVARRIGLHYVTFSRLECGLTSPPLGEVLALADVLDMSVVSLVGGTT